MTATPKIHRPTATTLLALAALAVIAAGCARDAVQTFTDTRDGKTYRTVRIGGLTWMAENLNFVTDSSVCYNNDESNCQKYGRLYTWDDAMKACPAPWRVPDTADWNKLALAVGGQYGERKHRWEIAGKKLKSKTGWSKLKDGSRGTDEFGFSALPGGEGFGVRFGSAGSNGYWWSAVEEPWDSDAWFLGMAYNCDYVGSSYDSKYSKFSLRCVEGSAAEPAAESVTPADTPADTITFHESDTSLTDAQFIEKALPALTRGSYSDMEVLNINKFLKIYQLPCACGGCVKVIISDASGERDNNDAYKNMGMSFGGEPYNEYSHHGSKSYAVEEFIEQTDDKREDGILLKNFIRKDRIITLEYADGSKVVFDVFYKGITENLDYWRKRLIPSAEKSTLSGDGGLDDMPGGYIAEDPQELDIFDDSSRIYYNAFDSSKFYAFEDSVQFNKAKTVLIKYHPWLREGAYTIPRGVKTIGKDAFHASHLTSVTIPRSVTKIEDGAFARSRLTSVTIPAGVKSIGDEAFALTDVTSVIIESGAAFIGNEAFYKCFSLKTVTIPASVKKIGYRAFARCDNLESVISQSPVPPATGGFVFAGRPPAACLYVPANSVNAYRDRDVWKRFKCVADIASAPKTDTVQVWRYYNSPAAPQ